MFGASIFQRFDFRSRSASIASSLFGFFFGLWFLGPKNVLPGSIGWTSRGDIFASQLSWQFFRSTPIFQWPITEIPNYGVGWGSLFQFTVGNNVIGIPFKLFNSILPDNFQFLGIWVVLCFVLQGFFAERLMSRFALSKLQCFIASLIFILSPTFLFRIGPIGHLELGAHWVIIAALFLYFGSNQKASNWAALISVSVMIQPYLLVMVIAIFVAMLGKELLVKKAARSNSSISRLTILPLVIFVFMCFVLGYLPLGGDSMGVGFFRLNVLAFFNPGFSSTDSFSFLLDHSKFFNLRQFAAEEGEGFQYIGLGIIIFIPVALLCLWSQRRSLSIRAIVPLLFVCGALFLIATSNRIVVVRHEFYFWLPQSILDARQIFRTATRFAWPLYYLVTAIVVVASARFFSKFNLATLAIILIASVQLIDGWPGMVKSHNVISADYATNSPFVDPVWTSIAKNYEKISLVPTFDIQDDDRPAITQDDQNIVSTFRFASFAAENGMSINFAYNARPVTEHVNRENAKTALELASGQLEVDAIYVFFEERSWNEARSHLPPDSEAVVIDGFFLILGPLSS